MLKLEKRPAL